MAYEINKTNGDVLTLINDGFVDNTTSLALPGPNYVGYGEKLNENLVHMLEHFAGNSTPAGTQLQGQLWFNLAQQQLNVYTSQGYIPVSGVTTASVQPASAKNGDIWFNTTTEQSFLYSNGIWRLVGPSYTKQQGNSGTVPFQVGDAATNTLVHNLVGLQYSDEIFAIISKDATFAPSPPIDNFPTISPGITFANTIQNVGFRATVTGNVVSQNNGTVVVNNLGATTIFTGNLVGSVTGNVAGNVVGNVLGNLTGNVVATQVTAGGLTVSGNITATNVTATNALIGTLFTAGQPNITSLGTLTALTVGTAGQYTTPTNIYGLAKYNGVEIATVGGTASFTSINNTPIGNTSPASGAFTTLSASSGLNTTVIGNSSAAAATFTTLTVNNGSRFIQSATFNAGLTASTVQAATIGNSGAQLTGTISTASQTNITSVGTLSGGTWNATVISPTYGGTGVNNGSNTLTVSGGNRTINQDISSGAAPTFNGANFTGIPASAVTGLNAGGTLTGIASTSSVSGLTLSGAWTSGSGTITLGGTIPAPTSSQITTALGFTPYNSGGATVLTSSNYSSYITSSGFTASSTLTGAVNTSSACTFGAVSAGNFSGSGYGRFAGDVVAFYSDRRLKTDIVPIENALGKVLTLSGVQYRGNDVAGSHGFDTTKQQVGVLADQILAVMPEAVEPAPFDSDEDGNSKSGENYLTVKYEKLVPLLIESIKELNAKIAALEARLK
jgi:hypothetical protein